MPDLAGPLTELQLEGVARSDDPALAEQMFDMRTQRRQLALLLMASILSAR
jgi:hypothetical protein